jgi:hypothetical protein
MESKVLLPHPPNFFNPEPEKSHPHLPSHFLKIISWKNYRHFRFCGDATLFLKVKVKVKQSHYST